MIAIQNLDPSCLYIHQNKRKSAVAILKVLQKHRRILDASSDYSYDAFIESVESGLQDNKPFKMLLPGFHCKSPNPESVLGVIPDGAEEESIRHLEHICNEIKEVYPPGCELLIIHEGHFVADIGMAHSDEVIEQYENFLHQITNSPMVKFTNIMSDYFSKDYNLARKMIHDKYMDSLEDVKKEIEKDPILGKKNKAYKAFIDRELSSVLLKGMTKGPRKKFIRELVYAWIQRYLIFIKVCDDLFQNYFRLTILSYDSKNKKFGINLLPNCTHGGMPWLNVLVKKSDNTKDFMKKHQAEELGYKLVYKNGEPWYYAEK